MYGVTYIWFLRHVMLRSKSLLQDFAKPRLVIPCDSSYYSHVCWKGIPSSLGMSLPHRD